MRIARVLMPWVAVVAMAIPAGAQFTAVVAPPKKPVDSATAAAAAATIAEQRDSTTRATMGDMREWVDSAAATLGVRVDSVPLDTTQRVVPVDPPVVEPAPTETFRDGAPAPDTATPLPLLAVGGGLLLLSGLWLLRRPACAESSARR